MVNTMDDAQGLAIWKKGLALGREIFELVDGFPQHDAFGLCHQMRRVAASMTSALAEGRTRPAGRDVREFFSQANGFLCDLSVQVIMCAELEYLPVARMEELLRRIGDFRLEIYGQMKHASHGNRRAASRPLALVGAAAWGELNPA